MEEYPRMLYRGSVGDTLTVGTFEDEESARADGWMSLQELKDAVAAPPKRGRGRPPKEPRAEDDADADSGEGSADE